MIWDNSIGILPALHLKNVATDSVIDMTLALIPRRALNTEMAAQIPAPVMRPPKTAFTGELAEIVTNCGKFWPKAVNAPSTSLQMQTRSPKIGDTDYTSLCVLLLAPSRSDDPARRFLNSRSQNLP